jgi:hypothetical protein
MAYTSLTAANRLAVRGTAYLTITFGHGNQVNMIKPTLEHLGLWKTRNYDPPQVDDAYPPTIETELTYDYTYSQLPSIDYWTQ